MNYRPEYSEKDVTFKNSKTIPFQRWYPYVEGYSPSFVANIINTYCGNPSLIYEPFAGTGTTLFAADGMGVNTIYSEVNPVLLFLIKVKTHILTMEAEKRQQLSEKLSSYSVSIFQQIANSPISSELDKSYKSAFGDSVYFSEEEYNKVLRLRSFIDALYNRGEDDLADLLAIASFSCLIPVSYLKKQGDVRFKTEKEMETTMKRLEDVLPQKIHEISKDVGDSSCFMLKTHSLITENAKNIGLVACQNPISDVITSPPYLNGTNYFRNTKLELWFLKHIKSEKDLRFFRDEALTSGINDVKREYEKLSSSINSSLLDKTISELEQNAYDTRIPLMAKCYFREMHEVFQGLTKHLKNNANVLIDIGDSIFSNVHIPTDLILVETLGELGYSLNDRVVLRDRKSRNGQIISQVLLSFVYSK